MEATVINTNGKDTGRTVALAESVFGIEPNEHVVYLDVKSYLAAQRQGTHKAKERGEVKGSRKKLRRQKGTGAARIGDIKNPLLRGGGRIFGPRPRNYSIKINRKTKQLARRVVLSDKVRNQKLTVLEDFNFDKPSTKGFVKLLSNLQLAEKKTLFVLPENQPNVFLSVRNIQNTWVLPVNELSTYHLINADTLVISEKSVEKIQELLSK